ncbi:MAG: cell division protein FtsA [Candidatus Yanofskybacteria bacterium]|nr:cell division protein FtsA [Candidatus Yanofskybacteria bacterium]
MKSHIIAALDIGTRTLKMGAGRRNEERGTVEILGIAEESSAGVRKGTVVHPDDLASRIVVLKARLEQICGAPLEEVFVNLGGSHVFVATSRGIVAVSRADSMVSQEDVDRVLQAAQALTLGQNQEVLDVFPQQYILDGVGGIRDVTGMKGNRLEVDVLAVCGFAPYVKNLTGAVLAAGLEIADIIPSSLATSAAVISQDQKELGVAVLEIGAGTTSLAVFEEGELLHTAAFPVGSGNITNDIAIGLQTEPELAERIKKEYGTLLASRGRKTERVELADGQILLVPQKKLSGIISARIKQIADSVNGELKKISRQGKLPAGIVLAGGGVKLPGLAEFMKKEAKLSVRVGTVERIEAFPNDPALLGLAGLLILGCDSQEYRPSKESWGLAQTLKKMLRSFIP